MYKTFYLFRHGETDYNLEKRWQGCSVDSILNPNGIKQAKDLADKLQNSQIQIIYSSELKRALQTSSIVAANLDVPLYTIAALREGNLGGAEGLLVSEVETKYPDIFKSWYSDENDMQISFPGGETKQQMQDRMFNVLMYLLDTPQETIGICSHGSSIRYLLMKFGIMPHRMINTARYKICYCNGNWTAERLD
ncbi:MAG: histidine phosphatase family protein [Alphaproteobacteria bacterium]|nr:histidine phosphatase family protein [Alphaproteobacteria bacterium]